MQWEWFNIQITKMTFYFNSVIYFLPLVVEYVIGAKYIILCVLNLLQGAEYLGACLE